jgi:Tfp pilus assembly protein PilF
LKLQGKRAEAEAAYQRAWAIDRSSTEAERELAAFGWTRQRLAAAVHRSAAPRATIRAQQRSTGRRRASAHNAARRG